MMVALEAACLIYVVGCLLAVAVDLWLHHSLKPRKERRTT
jgi:hypothetical protein